MALLIDSEEGFFPSPEDVECISLRNGENFSYQDSSLEDLKSISQL